MSLSPTANSLSSARELAHGKEALCRPLVAVSALPCVTHGKVFAVSEPAFAVCFWHTANEQSPVVISHGRHQMLAFEQRRVNFHHILVAR